MQARPGATLLPNDWGLFDMLGNVWEGVWDTAAGDSGDVTDPAGDPQRPAPGDMRRGPSARARLLHRSALRYQQGVGVRNHSVGFRVVCRPRGDAFAGAAAGPAREARRLIDLGRREAEQGLADEAAGLAPPPARRGLSAGRPAALPRLGPGWGRRPMHRRGPRREVPARVGPGPVAAGRGGRPRRRRPRAPAPMAVDDDPPRRRGQLRRGVRAGGARRGLCPGRGLVDGRSRREGPPRSAPGRPGASGPTAAPSTSSPGPTGPPPARTPPACRSGSGPAGIDCWRR